MKTERRVAAILGVVAVITLPAAFLRVLCIGPACDRAETTTRTVPFCSLPAHIRQSLASGYRDGRSPDILAVTKADSRVVSRSPGGGAAPWPSLSDEPIRVPVVFWGHGVGRAVEVPDLGLDDVAPTMAAIAGVTIPHPEVRSGRPAPDVATGDTPRLLLQIVIRDVRDVASDPVLDALSSAARADALVGSLPWDLPALLTTIGTGGMPAEHGITGSYVRNEAGAASAAWTPSQGSPPPPRSVIATLADDLDETTRQRARIGLVADTAVARGLVGGNWYVDNDRDDLSIVPTEAVMPELRALVRSGYGEDGIVDVIGVSVSSPGGVTPALHALRIVAGEIGDRFAAAIVVLPADQRADTISARALDRKLESVFGGDLVDADTAGGLFLDQRALARTQTTKESIVDELRTYRHNGEAVFADAFAGTAVAFARFC